MYEYDTADLDGIKDAIIAVQDLGDSGYGGDGSVLVALPEVTVCKIVQPGNKRLALGTVRYDEEGSKFAPYANPTLVD